MIVTVCSVRGSPGATSWSLLFAAAWPARIASERAVLEADPSGGVLGARYGWGVDPGAVSLVASLRRREGRVFAIGEHGRQIEARTWVVPGPESGDRVRSVWSASASEVAARMEVDARVWIIDAGRVEATNPSLGFVDRTALTVVVGGGRPEDVVQLPERVQALRDLGSAVAVLVTSSCSYSTNELREFTGAHTVWIAPTDGDLRDDVGAVVAGSRRSRRGLLWRRAVEVTAAVADLSYRCAPTDPVLLDRIEERA